MLEYLAIFGFMVLLCMVGYFLTWVYHEKVRQHIVAKHYQKAASKLWRSDWFTKTDERIEELTRRLYVAERNASNASYRINKHITDNKHTKTAKAVKRDKAQKKAVEDADLRCGGGDGM